MIYPHPRPRRRCVTPVTSVTADGRETTMETTGVFSYETMMEYLKRREVYLAQKVAEANAVGANRSWLKGELIALRQAMARLERQKGRA